MYNFTNNKIQYNKLKQPTHRMLMSISDHSVHIIKYVSLQKKFGLVTNRF